jgi:tripartite-type tricarboxylate transporter receptor subunit TctC
MIFLPTGDPMKRLRIATLLSAALGLSLVASQAMAQAYPNKPIKAIVPFAAGSATDQIGRAFAQKMSEALGQPVVVENKAGVNGMLGADAVAKSAPDGYTILIGTNSTNAALKSLMKKLPYDQDTAFAPVAYMGSVPLIVAVNNDVPAKNLKELVDLAKSKPTQVTFASASLATGLHRSARQHGRHPDDQCALQKRPRRHDRPDWRPGEPVHR